MTPLIFSADDYAQSAAIDAGILELIEQRRLSATSCLTLSPRWQQAAKLIDHDIQNQADIGLHLDFTQFWQPRYTLSALIGRAMARSLPVSLIETAIHTQLDRFEDALGRPPDYIDGHQHVHQLPQIRDSLLEAVTKRYSGKLPWLRIANPPVRDGLKGWIIRSLGATSLSLQASKAGLRCSANLLGVYAFDGDATDYMQKLGDWFVAAKSSNGVSALMCHPAQPGHSIAGEANDPIYQARLREFQVLSSPNFVTLLKQYDICAARGDSIANRN